MSKPTASQPAAAEGGTFWQRRVVRPIVQQLSQGISPEKIALTIALGFALSIFPILGSTTVLCGLAGALLRLNQPLIQMVNYGAYPVQLMLLIPFYRAGELLLRRAPVPLNIPLLLERFQQDTARFFQDFGMIAIGGILVWLLAAPVLIGTIYYSLRPALRALGGCIHRERGPISL